MKPSDYSFRKNYIGYLLVLPTIIAVILIAIYPLFHGIVIGFQNYALTKSTDADFLKFVGFKNYIDIFKLPEFRQSLRNTVIWTISNVAFQLVIATIVSLTLNKSLWARGFFRTASMVPWAVPSAIAALSFKFLFDTKIGIFNVVLHGLGLIKDNVSWLGNMNTALISVIIESVWKGTPFVITFVLAALQTIPTEIYESAYMDGASPWSVFSKITLPMIKEPVGIATILTTIGTINNFNAIYLMTQGGPLGSTEILFTYAYKKAYTFYDFGQASAISTIIFLIIVGLTFAYTKLIEDKED